MKRIVITSCSQRKKETEELLPAIERYDGPTFRLLRKFLKKGDTGEGLGIYILSAKYGLLSYSSLIPFYDEKLSFERVENLTELSSMQVDNILANKKNQSEIFVNLGSLYLKAFTPALQTISQNNSIVYTEGSSGRRLSEMHNWLYGENSPFKKEKPEIEIENEVFVKGIRVNTSETEIWRIVEIELSQNGTTNLQNFQSWFVPTNNLKVSPKWLISQLTGLPTSKFHSDQARKALQKLGISVNRI